MTATSDLIQKLYIGYFGRAGDPSGMNYWTERSTAGMTDSAIAQSFSLQDEAKAMYGYLAAPSLNMGQDAFLEAVYQNLFERSIDSAGLEYWKYQLNHGYDVGKVILAIINGAQGSDVTTVANKLSVANYYTEKVISSNATWTLADDQGDAIAVIASVTSVSSTVTTGKALADTLIAADTATAGGVGAVSDANSAANTVAENAAVGTAVGITASAVDPTTGDNVTYSLTTNPGSMFAIDATTGVVTVNGAVDYEAASSRTITVKATSSDGSSSTKDFTIAVTDVAESVGAVSDTNSAANSLAENATKGTAVGITASATDPQSADTVSYSLTSNPGSLFAIDAGTGVVTLNGALDYETVTSHSITVKATSSDGSSSTKDFTIAVTDVAEAQTFTLTTGFDRGAAFVGGTAGDTFNAGDDAGHATFTNGDELDGGLGDDVFAITSASAITTPSNIKVANIEDVDVSSAAEVTLNASAWTGLETLDVTAVGDADLTAAATTAVAAAVSAQAANGLTANGGSTVNLTATGATTGTITVGGTTAAAGAVTVSGTVAGAGGTTQGAIAVTGGTTVSVTTAAANAVNTTNTQAAVTVTGNSSTTAVTVNQDAAATAAGAVVGKVNGAVTVTDVNATSATAAGTISSVTLNSYGNSTIDSSALTTVSLSGTGGTLGISRGALTATPTANTLTLNVSAASAATSLGIITDSEAGGDDGFTTVNVAMSGAKSSTIADLAAADARTLNVSGSSDVTFTAASLLGNVTSVTVTNTGATTFGGTTLATGATFTGGNGAESVIIGATTKAIATGAGNDTVTVGVTALGTGGSIDAGDGTADVLRMSTANAETASGNGSFETSISNFERLTVSDSAASATINLANLDDINYVTSSGSAGTLTLTGAQSGFTLVQTAAATTGHTITLANSSGTADSMSVKLTAAATFAAGTITAAGVETVSIESDDTTTPDGTVNHTATLAASSMKSLVVSGDALLTLTNTNTTITSVDASAMTNAYSGLVWATVGNLASAATITGGSGNDNIGGTANGATRNLVMTGGDGQDTLGGGAGNDTITDTSVQSNGNGNNLIGGAGNDTITGGAGIDTIDGGTGNDSIVAGAGADVLTGGGGSDTILGGEGADAITAASGAESLDGGAGNDSYVMATYWGSTDVIADESGAADTLSVTVSAATTAGTTSGVETITATFDNNGYTLALASVSGVTKLNLDEITNGTSSTAVVTGLNSGATVVVTDDDIDAISIDTAASATLTIEQNVTSASTLAVTDAATVTITNTSSTAGVVTGTTTLDAVDTTSLTIAAGTSADLTLAAVAGTDKLQSATLSAQIDGQDLVVTSIADADSLTSLTLTASAGDVTITGDVGVMATTAGNAENLATISATASNGGIVTLTNVYADDSSNDATVLAMTITASAGALSEVKLGFIGNRYGTISASLSGEGIAGATGLHADDLDLTWSSSSASAITTVTVVDDLTWTNSGSGTHTITNLDVEDDVTITHTGSGELIITTVDTGIGNLVINAADATGKVTITTNNQASTTEGATMTGGSGADSLTGGDSNDSIVGGAGNDNLTGDAGEDTLSGGVGEDNIDGGAGNDTLLGGDNNDTITVGAGEDSVDGGAGNDTIALSTNWSSKDSIDGGDGTDTVTITTAGTVAPTLTNVEKVTVTTTDDLAALNAGNASSLEEITLAGAANLNMTVVNIGSGDTVISQLAAGNAAITLDSVAAGTLTLSLQTALAGALTVTDAASLTINAASTAANAAVGSILLDSSDTTSLTVTGAAGAYTLGTGVITGSDALASLTVSTSTTGGTVSVGTIADADGLTSLSVSASKATATVGAIGGGGNAELLSSVTVSASGGATASIGAITADSASNDATDLTMAVSATAAASSTATLDAIDNTYGRINATLSGAGTINFGSNTAAMTATSASVDATGVTGTAVMNLSGVSGTSTVTLASAAGEDAIVVGDDDQGTVVITGFEVGASGDQVRIDISKTGDAGLINGNGVGIVAGSAALEMMTTGNLIIETSTEVVVLSDASFATTALAQAAIENGGSHELSIDGPSLEAGDDLIIVWTDGTDVHVGVYRDNTTDPIPDGFGGFIDVQNPLAGGTLNTLVTLVGVDITTLHNDNFAFVA